MSDTPLTGPLDTATIRAALAAIADGPVRDNAPNRDAERDAVVAQADGLNPDDVEHVRQSRLRRWQEVR